MKVSSCKMFFLRQVLGWERWICHQTMKFYVSLNNWKGSVLSLLRGVRVDDNEGIQL